jgi:hypothetical protein
MRVEGLCGEKRKGKERKEEERREKEGREKERERKGREGKGREERSRKQTSNMVMATLTGSELCVMLEVAEDHPYCTLVTARNACRKGVGGGGHAL